MNNYIIQRRIIYRLIFFILAFVYMHNSSFAQMNSGGLRNGSGGSHRGMKRESSNAGNSMSEKKISLGEHGGEIKEVGKYKVEMVFDAFMKENSLTFFFITKKGKIINNSEIKAEVEISAQDNTPSYKVNLIPIGTESLSADVNNKMVPFICKVSFVIEGRNYSESFFNNGFRINKK